ncbi:GNAT family N-acetyltransferase [Ectobacillus panaciterrae]|uniref:GNAT family N-acetyltransferase n=1 Tax=Ectobacillus panaciterrae TaxID=363872 RepID=UPI000420CC9A|nr:GNAT family N-acetyltransferase [Ectobacillus panaciterrae]
MAIKSKAGIGSKQDRASEFILTKAAPEHIDGILSVCIKGWRSTYTEIRSSDYIERVIKNYYNYNRIYDEIMASEEGHYTWYVALEDDIVVGTIAGGPIDSQTGEIFGFYVDYERRGQGIGTLLLDFLTDIQYKQGMVKQWVSVAKGNEKGIPFYEARNFVRVSEKISRFSNEQERYMSYRYVRTIGMGNN